jgi:ATP-binding cassette, subfamily B, heavy metal transporter
VAHEYRLLMNRLESDANTQAVDSLINYETVKYFGNEPRSWSASTAP